MKKLVLFFVIAVIAVTSVFGLAACSDKNLIGYDIEVARAVATQLGLEIKFQEIDWDQKEVELEAKNIDCIWNGMTITDERAANMAISQQYLENKQVAVVRVEDKDKDVLSLDKYIAEAGSAGADFLEAKGKTFVSAAAQSDIFTELMASTANVGIMDSIMANYYINLAGSSYYGKLAVVEVNAEKEYYGIAFRKADTYTVYKFNKALYDLQQNGTIKTIADKYGLTSELVEFTEPVEPSADVDKSGWTYLTEKGNFILGYTLFAPIAYKK